MTSRARRRSGRQTPAQARAARRARRRARRRIIRVGAFAAVGIIALLFIVSLFAPNVASVLPVSRSAPDDGLWQRMSDQGNTHLGPTDEHAPYNSVPATSGWHYAQPLAPVRWGVHENVLPDEVLVHNLEHGGVGIHYNCPEGCPELADQLGNITRRARRAVMSPYPDIETRIALTAWNYIDKFDEFDEQRIEDFINAHLDSGNAPESGAR